MSALLDAYLPARAVDSETSVEAAVSMRSAAASIRAKVLAWIVARGANGATCDEVEELLGLRHQTASARINELVFKHSRLVDSGRRRATRSGRNATVWVEAGERPPETERAEP